MAIFLQFFSLTITVILVDKVHQVITIFLSELKSLVCTVLHYSWVVDNDGELAFVEATVDRHIPITPKA